MKTRDLSNILKMIWDRTDALKIDAGSGDVANDTARVGRNDADGDGDDDFELFAGINRTTEIYSRLQKLFCGRKIPRENLASLFGSGADRSVNYIF